jgi:NAD-dependent deacetylase sirtuin 4
MVSMRIPYTGPLPKPRIIPADAEQFAIAVDALIGFLTAGQGHTVLLTGAGISVAVSVFPCTSKHF